MYIVWARCNPMMPTWVIFLLHHLIFADDFYPQDCFIVFGKHCSPSHHVSNKCTGILESCEQTLLVGMQIDAATVENSLEFPQKTKNGTVLT